MRLIYLCASAILSIGVLLSGCSDSDKEIGQANRPYPGVNSWLSFNYACRDSEEDDWRCDAEYLVKLDSIRKKGDILLFENWYDGKYYNNAINCRKSEVYGYNPKAKSGLKYTNGYKFDPKGDLSTDASAGRLFCELAANNSNKGFSLSDGNSWVGVNPLALKGEWIKHKQELYGSKPYDWYYNRQISKKDNSVMYAVYARYNPSETIWSKIWSAIKIASPEDMGDERSDVYGWRRVDCDSGDWYVFLPYTPMDIALASKAYRGVWLPKAVVADNIASYIRRTYC